MSTTNWLRRDSQNDGGNWQAPYTGFTIATLQNDGGKKVCHPHLPVLPPIAKTTVVTGKLLIGGLTIATLQNAQSMDTYLFTRDALNVEVSCFANYRKADEPRPVNMLKWLTSTKYAAEVDAIRATVDKAARDDLKWMLPAITPSGLFTYRNADSLVSHSSLLQFDIDFKDNRHIRNYGDLKAQIRKLPFIAYVGLSASGTGYWGLVPIAYSDRHGQHFDALKRVFAYYGIIIDDKPRNVASLRGYSYDPEGWFSEKVMVFDLYDEPTTSQRESSFVLSMDADADQAKVEECIQLIRRNQIDITGDHRDWYRIAYAFADAYGEKGRDYFHEVGQFHQKYSPAESDKVYTYCLQRNTGRVSLATFFWVCQQHGVQPEQTNTKAVSYPSTPRIVTSLADWQPGTILRPSAGQLEYLTGPTCDHYPAEWDQPGQPAYQLVSSPRREAFARILRVRVEDLDLTTFTQPTL